MARVVVSVPLPPEEMREIDARRRQEQPQPLGRGPFVRKLMREGMAARQAQGQTPAPTA